MAAAATDTTSSDYAQLAAAFKTLAEAMTEREYKTGQVPVSGELVTVGENSDRDLERQIFCRDCLDVRKSADPGEPPQGGSSWGSHTTAISGSRRTVEHPRKPKTMSYDRTAVLAGLEKGTHGRQCLQCGVVLLQEVR